MKRIRMNPFGIGVLIGFLFALQSARCKRIDALRYK
jgi:hypothetical protein